MNFIIDFVFFAFIMYLIWPAFADLLDATFDKIKRKYLDD